MIKKFFPLILLLMTLSACEFSSSSSSFSSLISSSSEDLSSSTLSSASSSDDSSSLSSSSSTSSSSSSSSNSTASSSSVSSSSLSSSSSSSSSSSFSSSSSSSSASSSSVSSSSSSNSSSSSSLNSNSSSSSSSNSSSSSSSSASSSNSSSSSSSSSAWPSEPIHEITSLDFYALNDFHGAVEYKPDTTYPEVGITRLATYFDQREAANPEGTVLLAAGDMFQGSADSNITYGKVVVDSMNAMNFDAMEIGNHEFDWTDTYIYENQQRANFPFLGANIIDKTTGQIAAFAEPYTMIERQGIRIGIIGIIGDTLESSILPSAITNYDFQAGANYVIDSASALRSQGANIVIVLDHNGSIDNSVIPYVDAVFLGHTHSYGNTITNGVPLMQAYCNGEAVSHVTLSYNKTTDAVTLGTHEVVQGIAGLDLNEATDVKAIVDSYGDVINPIKNEVVGTLTSVMSESQFGNFTVQAMLEYGQSIDSGVVASFHNISGIRATLPSGEVTYGDIYAASPFDNDLIICTVTGAQLTRWLSRGNYKAGASGSTLPDGSPIVSTNTYKVIAISYLTENTSTYPHSAEESTGAFARDAARLMFLRLGTVNPNDY